MTFLVIPFRRNDKLIVNERKIIMDENNFHTNVIKDQWNITTRSLLFGNNELFFAFLGNHIINNLNFCKPQK